jgi:outer membrane protein
MTGTELINAQKELQLLQENFQKFEQECEATSQRNQKQLMVPVSQSIQKAITDVAQENNYLVILSAGADQSG